MGEDGGEDGGVGRREGAARSTRAGPESEGWIGGKGGESVGVVLVAVRGGRGLYESRVVFSGQAALDARHAARYAAITIEQSPRERARGFFCRINHAKSQKDGKLRCQGMK